MIGAAETATYRHVLRLLTTEGGVNAWLARAVTVLFVVGVSYGLRLAVSLKSKQRRTLGWAILAGTFVAFNLTFDADQTVVQRLRLFDGPPRCLLLAKANFSQAEKTDFEGLISVQGKLAIMRLNKDGRTGPWTFNASGAGNNPTTATEACAKRLVEQIDVGVIFPN